MSYAQPAGEQEAIRSHLQRVVASPVFAGSDRLVRFLEFVVGESLAGRAEGLKEIRIGAEVFGRRSDYDPKIDPIVRVQARRLRAKLEQYYAGPGSGEDMRIELPKGG